MEGNTDTGFENDNDDIVAQVDSLLISGEEDPALETQRPLLQHLTKQSLTLPQIWLGLTETCY